MHMEPNISEKINQLEAKVDAIYVSVEKTRKYFFWTMVISVAFIVLPAVGLVFAIPSFVSTYTGNIDALTQ